MVSSVRRVVTGHDSQGRSTILFDQDAMDIKEMESKPGLALTDLWETDASPVDNGSSTDTVMRPVRLEPTPGGSIFRIVEFPPDKYWRENADASRAFSSVGARSAHHDASTDPIMHKTSTVDYLVVLQGEIYAIVETGEVLLKAGDTFIQRGTVHSWSMRGDEPCSRRSIHRSKSGSYPACIHRSSQSPYKPSRRGHAQVVIAEPIKY